MKHSIFSLILIFYILIIGQNWAFYAAALMIAAYIKNDGDLSSSIYDLSHIRRFISRRYDMITKRK